MSHPDDDPMRSEYDFSEGERGTHYQAFRRRTNLVHLDADVAEIFKDSESVNNNALRALAQIADEHARSTS